MTTELRTLSRTNINIIVDRTYRLLRCLAQKSKTATA